MADVEQPKRPKCCPDCGGRQTARTGGAFVESGEWDGKSYEKEFDCYLYKCNDCGAEFAV